MAKALTDIRSLARTHTRMVIRTFAHIVKNPASNEMARIAAGRELLNRGWGQPTQEITGDATLNVIVKRFAEELQQTPALVIDASEDEQIETIQ